MNVLVAVASKHGATQGIARYIAETLRAAGHRSETRPARSVRSVAGYDAVVIGGAAYLGHWLKEATEFVERNAAALRSRPVWLFSSGPLGEAVTDAQGRNIFATGPKSRPGRPRSLARSPVSRRERAHEPDHGGQPTKLVRQYIP